MVRPKGLSQQKIPLISLGIEPVTFQLVENVCTFLQFAEFFLQWEMFKIKVAAEKIKTRFTFNNFVSENRAVCELIKKNVM